MVDGFRHSKFSPARPVILSDLVMELFLKIKLYLQTFTTGCQVVKIVEIYI